MTALPVPTPSVDEPLPELRCFDCGSPVHKTRCSGTFVYGVDADSVELTVDLPVHVCGDCGFQFFDHEAEILRHEAVCRHRGVLSPREIRGIRTTHGMSRADFARVTGLTEEMLERWEQGIEVQRAAHDRLLRLLTDPANLRALQRLPAPSPRLVGGQERRTLGPST